MDSDSRTVIVENSDIWSLSNGFVVVARAIIFGATTLFLIPALGQGLGDFLFILAMWLLMGAFTFGVGFATLEEIGDDSLVVEAVGGRLAELPASEINSVWASHAYHTHLWGSVTVICRRRCAGRWVWMTNVSDIRAARQALADDRPYPVSLF